MFSRLGGLGVVLLVTACNEVRPREGELPCTVWVEDVESVLEAECASCHGGDSPAGAYDLNSYLGALGSGTDTVSNAIAGEPDSKILTVLSDTAPIAAHRAPSETRALLESWVVECRVPHRNSIIHEGGILNPDDFEFHGGLLRRLAYNFDECAKCHGSDFSGGTSQASCLGCHPAGPTNCVTCHGPSGPTNGRHLQHREPVLTGKVYSCNECHVVPLDYKDVGHILLANGAVDPPPADVRFSERSGPNAEYESGLMKCSGVLCHGAAFEDPSARLPEPIWDDALSNPGCDSCHGRPPASHAASECVTCHQQSFSDPNKHIDGKVQIGRSGDGCDSCHGDAGDPAPPTDLFGGASTSSIGVGAHQSHLRGPQRLSNPLLCIDCHQVPSSVDAPGHIDSELPAEVFPVATSSSSLAFADRAEPSWDRATAQCSNVYCHGGGRKLSADGSPGINREPVWIRVGEDEVVCGSCHGLPPVSDGHIPPITLLDCYQCHATSVDELGEIIFTGPAGSETTVHINGLLDF